MHIGPYWIASNLVVAPMAGVSDRPFRRLCRQLGAGYAVSEMVAANPRLRGTPKSRRRIDHGGEAPPVAVQIAGADPEQMADAARYNVELGAQVIDINMGCPAKKVCNLAAGSALLRDEPLVAAILAAVVAAVSVPVTLKIRTGWDRTQRNAVRIARLAEQEGVQALAVHGRTRACGFAGPVDYATIAAVKSAVRIPVMANGDIDSPQRARAVLACTGADAVMIGRAAQGRPWLFREVRHFLDHGKELASPTVAEAKSIVLAHLADHYAFYGEADGVRSARKHIGWYVQGWQGGEACRRAVNGTDSAGQQLAAVGRFFDALAVQGERLDAGMRAGVSGRSIDATGARQTAAYWGGEALAA